MASLIGVDKDIVDFLIKTDLSGQGARVVLAVATKHPISLADITKLIGCSKARCSQIVKKLVFMKIITVDENINGVRKTFVMNEDTRQWHTVYKNINRSTKHKRSTAVQVAI